jgi:hypothetical protein
MTERERIARALMLARMADLGRALLQGKATAQPQPPLPPVRYLSDFHAAHRTIN